MFEILATSSSESSVVSSFLNEQYPMIVYEGIGGFIYVFLGLWTIIGLYRACLIWFGKDKKQEKATRHLVLILVWWAIYLVLWIIEAGLSKDHPIISEQLMGILTCGSSISALNDSVTSASANNEASSNLFTLLSHYHFLYHTY